MKNFVSEKFSLNTINEAARYFFGAQEVYLSKDKIECVTYSAIQIAIDDWDEEIDVMPLTWEQAFQMCKDFASVEIRKAEEEEVDLPF